MKEVKLQFNHSQSGILLFWRQQVVKDHSDFAMGKQVVRGEQQDVTPISPAHSLITGFCLILYPMGMTPLRSTPNRQHPEQWGGEITSVKQPNTCSCQNIRQSSGNCPQKMSAHRKRMRVARTRRHTGELQTSVQLGGRYMSTVLSQAPGHLFLLMSPALNVKL